MIFRSQDSVILIVLLFSPQLTRIDIPTNQLGIKATELLFQLIHHQYPEEKNHSFNRDYSHRFDPTTRNVEQNYKRTETLRISQLLCSFSITHPRYLPVF